MYFWFFIIKIFTPQALLCAAYKNKQQDYFSEKMDHSKPYHENPQFLLGPQYHFLKNINKLNFRTFSATDSSFREFL